MKTTCLFTISAPSGAGKTSLVKALLAKKPTELAVSVSHTTREIRPGEVNETDYHFVSINQFESMIQNNKFIEHAQVFDNSYGTTQRSVEDIINSGKHVILEIDWQGAKQVKQKMPDTVCIFILPPSRKTLEQRLVDRGTDDKPTIKRRMESADREMSRWNDAEYLVVNENFNQALYDLECIIHAQGMTKKRQILKNKLLIDSIQKEIV